MHAPLSSSDGDVLGVWQRAGYGQKSHHLAMVPVKLNSHAATSGLEVHLTDVRILLSARDFRTALRILPMLLHKLERRPELDALRGLFLVWMTLTHLPTRFSDFVNQPIGFVWSAEGFVFISALLVGRLFTSASLCRIQLTFARSCGSARSRSMAITSLMLAFAFTVVAAFAAHTHKAALYKSAQLLSFPSDDGDCRVRAALVLPATPRHFANVCHVPIFHANASLVGGCDGVGEESSWRAVCSGYWHNSDCATWCITGWCTSRI